MANRRDFLTTATLAAAHADHVAVGADEADLLAAELDPAVAIAAATAVAVEALGLGVGGDKARRDEGGGNSGNSSHGIPPALQSRTAGTRRNAKIRHAVQLADRRAAEGAASTAALPQCCLEVRRCVTPLCG